MELLQLRYFLTVAKTLNISHAARHHLIPQPAMSKTISKLEGELGTPLFDRYKNKLTLTEAGKAFYRAVSLSLGELDDGVQAVTAGDAPLCGELKLLVRQHRENVVDGIAAFKRLYPGVSFRIAYEPDEREDYHLCIAGQPPGEDFSGSTRLITERLMLVVSRQHPAAACETVDFASLQQEEFAVVSRDSFLWQQTALHCRQAGFEPRISITCGDLHCLLKYVAAGMAITVGPEKAWQSLSDEEVAFVPLSPTVLRATYLFHNQQKSLSQPCRVFRDFLIDYFAQIQGKA